jgi:dTDP-4-dehydrorhamnose 3,5-epimerase
VRILSTELAGVLVVEPSVFRDERGEFVETWNRRRYAAAGIDVDFVQDNHSRSVQGVVRGLHYQIERPQGKLVWATAGEVYDVAVDLRRSSPTFGRWTAVRLSADSHRQIYIPPGLAHGFCALTPQAEVAYKCTDFYAAELERTILWNDPQLAIPWPIVAPLLSDKDQRGLPFGDALKFD